jgi:hypothetical protein
MGEKKGLPKQPLKPRKSIGGEKYVGEEPLPFRSGLPKAGIVLPKSLIQQAYGR